MDSSETGLVQRSLRAIFHKITLSQVESLQQSQSFDSAEANTSSTEFTSSTTTAAVSFFEIYNEKIYDLLSDEKLNVSLSVREDQKKGVYVKGLREIAVNNTSDTEVRKFFFIVIPVKSVLSAVFSIAFILCVFVLQYSVRVCRIGKLQQQQ